MDVKLCKLFRNEGLNKAICICGYLLVPIFFVSLYFLMTKTYEDFAQGNTDAGQSIFVVLDHVYHYLPRLGEFCAWVSSRFMTPQLSFGLDMVFRIITAVASSGLIYLATMFALGRKLKLQYKDVAIYLGIMFFLMISPFSEVFMYRFNYVSNYIFALLVTVGVLLLFRLNIKTTKWLQILGSGLLGFLFGFSTEITPIAVLILLAIYVIYKLYKKELNFRNLWNKYRLQVFTVLGVLFGLIFFYSGAGVKAKIGMGANYANIYEYVALTQLFDNFWNTLYILLQHTWYNFRYIFFAVPLMLMYVLIEGTIFKKDQEGKYLFWQIILLGFSVLFIGTTSLIRVHDDLYARFMIPVFMAVILATALFISHVLNFEKILDSKLRITAIILIILNVIMIVDMSYAFVKYNRQVEGAINSIKFNQDELIVELDNDEKSKYDMQESPIFRFKQLSPFDWEPTQGFNYMKFGS